MPCYDPPMPHEAGQIYLPAIVCALARKHGITFVLDLIDREVAGDPAKAREQVAVWWAYHEKQDAERKLREGPKT